MKKFKTIIVLIITLLVAGCSFEIKGEVTPQKQSFSLKVDGLSLLAEKNGEENKEDLDLNSDWGITIPIVASVLGNILTEETFSIVKDLLVKLSVL